MKLEISCPACGGGDITTRTEKNDLWEVVEIVCACGKVFTLQEIGQQLREQQCLTEGDTLSEPVDAYAAQEARDVDVLASHPK